jgi:hypothetical protein
LRDVPKAAAERAAEPREKVKTHCHGSRLRIVELSALAGNAAMENRAARV